jgi:lipoprotein-releasing system ATP-binding protein
MINNQNAQSSTSQYVVEARNILRRLEGEIPVTLVDNANVSVKKGEFVSITGPSGSGKSSLLYILGLLDKATSGEVYINGIDTTKLEDNKLADFRLSNLGFVFQFHFLLPEFTALENVMLPMQKLDRLSQVDIATRAKELLVKLDLEKQFNKLPKQLSGGQSQRVAIARALANEPKIILADEPTGNLDTKSSLNVQDILLEQAHSNNQAVIIVSHDTNFAKRADRIINIVDGKIIT